MELRQEGLSVETFKDFTDYINEIKELLSSDLWENIFLNSSKVSKAKLTIILLWIWENLTIIEK